MIITIAMICIIENVISFLKSAPIIIRFVFGHVQTSDPSYDRERESTTLDLTTLALCDYFTKCFNACPLSIDPLQAIWFDGFDMFIVTQFHTHLYILLLPFTGVVADLSFFFHCCH